jgi:hypothetical protein
MVHTCCAVVAALAIALPAVSEEMRSPAGEAVALHDLDLDGLDDDDLPEGLADAGPLLSVTGRIALDRSHGGFLPIRGFLQHLVDSGWTVTEIRSSPLALETLSEYDILIVPPPIFAFTSQEVSTVEQFLDNGHGMWVFHDIYWSVDPTNSLARPFGVQFKYDQIYDFTDNEGAFWWPTIHLLAPHPVTRGVGSYGFYAGPCLNAFGPARAIAWGDDDAYSQRCSEYPAVMAAYDRRGGRAVFQGDTTPLYWTYFPDQLDAEEILLLHNIVEWLAVPEHPRNPGLVDGRSKASPRLTPLTPEPWGQIKAGYR